MLRPIGFIFCAIVLSLLSLTEHKRGEPLFPCVLLQGCAGLCVALVFVS